MELTTQSQNSNTRGHLTLNRKGYLQDQILDPLDRTGFDNRSLVSFATSGEVAQCRDSVALNLFILVKGKKFDQRREETRVDNGALIVGVDRDVAHACRG